MLYNQGQRAISPDLGLGPAGQSQTALSSSGFPTQVLNRNQVSSTNRVPSFQQNSQPTTPATQAAPLWPSIACPPESFKKGDIRWMRNMNEVLQAIPGNQVIIPLVNEFFLEARRSWHPLHEVLVREEFRQFLTHRSDPGFAFDPAWLALFCSMLCTSAIDIQDNPASFSASPIELQRMDLSRLSKDLLLASDTALLCSDWMMRPQMRVLYTYLVRVSRSVDLEMMTGVVPGAYQTTIVGTMAGICKLLNLDQLGSDPLKMPDDDPMLPPGSSTLKRQLACQAFNAVFFYDTFSEFRQGLNRNSLSYAFVAGSYTTEASQNFKETMNTTSIVPPRPLTEYTENTWEVHKHRLAMHWRRTSENLAVGFGSKTYETLLARDAELREEHRELLDIEFVGINPNDTSFGVMDSGYHQRFLNLHRPFLIRSYREPRYIYSQRSCVESSFRITSLHRETFSRPGLKAWYLYRHHLSAITVLFIHALHTPYEVPRVKSELRMSLELFEKSKVCKLPSIIRAAGRGDSIILAMLQVSPYRTTEVVLLMSYG
ncbi:hypothetical protein HD553DRAFT_124282 [Filobasidium floriforme]|uniref:uncharacterized protein n=1 Tax=Filobasidium floriforme TaxID=5210 RepID=UPI001E8CBCAA|nr:uncharacterized protein HD553DRAFT_124282 [Filobasidium floriforme]KAH8079878.1 hypothetical protein HD553DRAFT_124282 [Filobasidium floriforme]